jgi:hypothetical protein
MSLTTSTWTGDAKTAWNNAADWSAGVPGAGTVADIAASHALNYKGFASFAEADVFGTLNIANGSYLTLTTVDGGSGALDIAAGGQVNFTTTGGTLELQGGIIGDATINFGGPANPGTLFWNPTDPTVTISSALTLDNFFLDSELDVATDTYTGAYSYDPSTDVLTLGGVGAVSLAHSYTVGGPDYTTSDFTVVNDGGTLEITSSYPCFLRGTRIATLRGDVAVEDLRIGDLVVTATGGALPIKWIGTRGFITRLVNEHHRAALLPIRIAAGALGEASPARDLHVSPEHMLCLEGVLIPAERLLNGTTITRADGFDVVQYFHIELPRHAVLYADGAPAESFLDTGNRNMFANVLSYLELGRDLDAPPQPPCLPIVTSGQALDSARAHLTERARTLGVATTKEDDLYLRVDGIALRPELREGEHVRFAVPAGARQVHIVSRSVVPADLDPANDDRRRLGICFSAMSLRDDGFTLDLAPGYAGFTAGFHAAEAGQRWTQGDASLPEDLTAAMPDGFALEMNVINSGLHYPVAKPAEVIPFTSRRSA